MSLGGFLWNQAELQRGDPLNDSLLTLMAIRDDRVPRLIGTAFIVHSDGMRATAISAAHCFREVRKILHPNMMHHETTPREFLPPPKEIDLARAKAIYIKSGIVHVCNLEIAVWDSSTDLALLNVFCPAGSDTTFRDMLWLTDDIPAAGDEVAMIGYGNLKVTSDPTEIGRGVIERELILRLGIVENVHPAGSSPMLRGPCIETTIPIYGGMSGGLVARWQPDTQIRPFAFISYASEPQPISDRSASGHSIASLFNARVTVTGDKQQTVQFEMNDIGVGRTIDQRDPNENN